MKAMHYTLEQLNALPADTFVTVLSGIFEHSPWVAEAAASQRPFASVGALHDDDVGRRSRRRAKPRQLALINAHPELAGKAAVRGELTEESTREQSGAGLEPLHAGRIRPPAGAQRRVSREVRLSVHPCRARL